MSQMIENSDRGVTLNKGLAWSILTALVASVWWGGATITALQSDVQALVRAVGERREENTGLESRVRALESGSSRAGAQLEALSRSMDEMRAEQRATNDLLRRILQGGSK